MQSYVNSFEHIDQREIEFALAQLHGLLKYARKKTGCLDANDLMDEIEATLTWVEYSRDWDRFSDTCRELFEHLESATRMALGLLRPRSRYSAMLVVRQGQQHVEVLHRIAFSYYLRSTPEQEASHVLAHSALGKLT
jgi:hypothetical protein